MLVIVLGRPLCILRALKHHLICIFWTRVWESCQCGRQHSEGCLNESFQSCHWEAKVHCLATGVLAGPKKGCRLLELLFWMCAKMWCTIHSILDDAQESAKLILESEKFEASYKKVRRPHLLFHPSSENWMQVVLSTSLGLCDGP